MVLTAYRHCDQVGAEDNRLADGNGSWLPEVNSLVSCGLLVAWTSSLVTNSFGMYLASSSFFAAFFFLLPPLVPIRFGETPWTLRLCFPFQKLFGKKNLLTLREILGGLHNPVEIVFYLGFRLGLGSRWRIWEFGTLFTSVLGQKLVLMVCLPFSYPPPLFPKKLFLCKELANISDYSVWYWYDRGIWASWRTMGVLCDRVHLTFGRDPRGLRLHGILLLGRFLLPRAATVLECRGTTYWVFCSTPVGVDC